jgi:heme/copper-type cytochrome/quinol oxidase subunit 2
MYHAVIRCSKVPIICSNQCGHSHNYCNGNILCNSQRPVIEYVEEAQQNALVDLQTVNQQLKAEIAALKKELSCYRNREQFVKETKIYDCY